MKFKELFAHFKEMKHYFIASTLVFSIGIFLGAAYADQFLPFLHKQMKGIQTISQTLGEKENPQLLFFIFIFLNNAIKAVLFIFLGMLFGVLPLFMLIVNGMLLGFVVSQQAIGPAWVLIVKGILPHGIIEIPAIVLACAYGLRLGMIVLRILLYTFFPARRTVAFLELFRVLKLTPSLIVLLVVSLFIAAVIESTLTFWLMQT